VLSARSVPQLEAVADEIRAAGGLADVLPWDLSGPDPAGLVTACLRRHGRVDVLVHAAGNQVRKPLFDYTPGDFDALLAVHLRAAFLLSQAAGRDMAARGSGSIVFIGSLTSERLGLPTTAGYAAAKSGLLGLMLLDRFPLARADQAFAAARRGRAVKPILVPDDHHAEGNTRLY
jgi:NAD(P)-dependent dehydrogenase (short-subunit alcohol dehydrogenase family)